MPALIVIPARYESTRFPGKPLASLGGKPIIQHVWERSSESKLAARVLVATDHVGIKQAVEAFGGEAVMTRSDHHSGTDRIAEVAAPCDYDIIVNVQGDEPLIKPEIIDASIKLLLDDERAAMGTLASVISVEAEIEDPNVVKVVCDLDGFALYFSRSPIPYHRDNWKLPTDASARGGELLKHIGIYSYRRDVLLRLSGLEPTRLEQLERLEQLRALEHGIRIKVGLTKYETMGVDTPEDLERVKGCLLNISS